MIKNVNCRAKLSGFKFKFYHSLVALLFLPGIGRDLECCRFPYQMEIINSVFRVVPITLIFVLLLLLIFNSCLTTLLAVISTSLASQKMQGSHLFPYLQ